MTPFVASASSGRRLGHPQTAQYDVRRLCAPQLKQIRRVIAGPPR